jgi:hypothetical protein
MPAGGGRQAGGSLSDPMIRVARFVAERSIVAQVQLDSPEEVYEDDDLDSDDGGFGDQQRAWENGAFDDADPKLAAQYAVLCRREIDKLSREIHMITAKVSNSMEAPVQTLTMWAIVANETTDLVERQMSLLSLQASAITQMSQQTVEMNNMANEENRRRVLAGVPVLMACISGDQSASISRLIEL